MNFGLVGLGRMGGAMAQRLTAEGCKVVAWDHDRAVTQPLAVRGIEISRDARSIAKDSDIVISIISEDSGARRLFHGDEGFLSTDVTGKLFVEMSTLQPQTVRELAAAVEARGARLIDSPVLGSIPTVHDGKLLALVGGRGEDIERARVVHDRLTRRVIRMGHVGSGCAMKLAVNLAMAAYLQALSEGLSLGVREGLDLAQMLDVLSEAPTANAWLALKLNTLKGAMGETTMDIRTMRKDAMSAVAAGALAGLTMPVAAGALSALSAAVAGGWGELDVAELPRFFREAMVQTYPQRSADR
jgi:3-hydroxyisobutyrate dehydrogenase